MEEEENLYDDEKTCCLINKRTKTALFYGNFWGYRAKNDKPTFVIAKKIMGYSVVGITESAFQECSKMKSVFIPSSVARIIGETFAKCSSLETINLPDTFITCGKGCFHDTNRLQHVIVDFNASDDWLGTALNIFRNLS